MNIQESGSVPQRFFTSDTHFGHARIIELCDRPFKSVEHMDETLINNWNETVSPGDIVYHLGDVALGSWDRWDGILSRLNGHKILVVGNHDRIFAGASERHRERFTPIYEQWFVDICDFDTLTFRSDGVAGWDTQLTALSHFPYDGDSHGEERYREFRPKDEGFPLIHGHTHGRDQKATVSQAGTPMFHVGVDAHDYRPVHESEILEWLHSI